MNKHPLRPVTAADVARFNEDGAIGFTATLINTRRSHNKQKEERYTWPMILQLCAAPLSMPF